jgi:hypothetical protein
VFSGSPFGETQGGPVLNGGGQTEQVAGEQVQRLVAQGGKNAHEFGFAALIGAAPGLYLDGGGTVAGHGIEEGPCAMFQALSGGRVQGAGRGLLILPVRSRGGKGEVGVAVDERGHDYPPGSVDLDGLACLGKILDTAGRSYFHDCAVAYEDSAVVNDTQVAERGSQPRRRAAPQCQQTSRSPN